MKCGGGGSGTPGPEGPRQGQVQRGQSVPLIKKGKAHWQDSPPTPAQSCHSTEAVGGLRGRERGRP